MEHHPPHPDEMKTKSYESRLEALDDAHEDHGEIGELDHRVVRPASALHIGS